MIWIKVTSLLIVFIFRMEKIELLRRFGLFDRSVPRYTSYPPANHFVNDAGRKHQNPWLKAIPEGTGVSIYVHIPFCKRLCWFCACRTQGTSTLRPVEAYVHTLLAEVEAAKKALKNKVKLQRLHLGGGTPTLLTPALMTELVTKIRDAFEPMKSFEFSVEVDPTEASDELLETLADLGLTRASIGVQDFAPKVQAAIGRKQTIAQTQHVVQVLRQQGVTSINFDVLYGLPHQTRDSFQRTLNTTLKMSPDRLAIYGYAHVPWVSKRQVLISEADLPGSEERFHLAEIAHRFFTNAGYRAIGIDHFARPADGLALAKDAGTLRRNFQGYTDDDSPVLLGFGASAISKFPQGYAQNAVATSAYQDRVRTEGFAAHRGFSMTRRDQLHAMIIERLLCDFSFSRIDVCAAFPDLKSEIDALFLDLCAQYTDVLAVSSDRLTLRDGFEPLARIIAKSVDVFRAENQSHSKAI